MHTLLLIQEALQKKADRMKRFGLQKHLFSGLEDSQHIMEQREARAKRFGTVLVASEGEPIKLVNRYTISLLPFHLL